MADAIDDIAGEYVLGTLDVAERRAFERRLLTDPAVVAAVAGWQERLSPLLLMVPQTAPPPALWRRIEAQGASANDNGRLRRWQMATAAAALVALVSTGIALRPAPTTIPAPAPQMAQAPAPAQFRSIAALTQQGGTPALLVTYDPGTRKVLVTPVNVGSHPGRSLELWAIGGEGIPKSIGLMRDKGATALERLAIDIQQDMTIAVSVEPRGGSPTGLPTGPVIYSGKMVSLPTS